MIRLLRKSLAGFSGSNPRRQNFFELNPIFPDMGQKDFDIYNVDYKHVQGGQLAISDEQRYMQLKAKLTKTLYLNPVNEQTFSQKKGDYEIDEETGFPFGIHQDFDNFIQVFKRQKKVGDNVVGEFEDLTINLMKKFEAKTEMELVKLFRFNIANLKKQAFKDKFRALLINNAFIKFIRQKKQTATFDSLSFSEMKTFLEDNNDKSAKRPTNQISKEELQQLAFRQFLADFDNKIKKIEEEIHKKALTDKTFVPTYSSKYGQSIKQQLQSKQDYDLNFNRGLPTQLKTNIKGYTPLETQQSYIEKRINRLFFLQAVSHVQRKQDIRLQAIPQVYDLPIHIRQKDKLINSVLHKYKEYDLMIEPDLEDIYKEIDIALKKISIKVVPNIVENQAGNQSEVAFTGSQVKERIISKDLLIWSSLDVEEVFQPDYYEDEEVKNIKLADTQIEQITPSAILQLSLNKMPVNLFRHADLDNFGVFNKYRKRIYKDYITDRKISPEVEFKFFSLEEAKNTLKKVKRSTQVPDKYFGSGKRKSSEAEVTITQGNGKVIVNGEPLADYFGDVYHRGQALKPLIFTETAGKYDLDFQVVGGGLHSQSQCMSIALTNALISINPKYKGILEQIGLVGIDDRKKEAKTMGLYSARVRPPYVRR